MSMFKWQEGSERQRDRPSVRERLSARLGAEEATRRMDASQQGRQRRQLRQYKKRTKRTARKLSYVTGEEYSATPPVPGRTMGLMDVFEMFRVLQYPIFNAAREIGAGGDFGKIMQSALEGVTLKQRSTGDDVLEAFGVKKSRGRSLAGFGMDLLLDPMNFVGGPLGMTKLGRLSKLKAANQLDNLMDGSRLAKQVLGMFPNEDLAGAVAKIPDLAETFAGQAAKGQRALLTWRGNKLVNNQAVMEKLAPAHETLMAWGPVKWLSNWFTGISNKGAKRIADAARWYHTHMDEQFRQEGAELLSFINEAGDEAAKVLIGLNESPALISWATIIMADKGHFPHAAASRVARVREVAQKVLKRKKLVGPGRDLIKGTLRMGFTEGDVDALIDTLENAIGPAMAKELNMDNPGIKALLKGPGKGDDFLFNPYMMEELFKVIDPDVEMRGVLARVMGGQGGVLSAGTLQRKAKALKHTVKGRAYKKPYVLPNFTYHPGPEPLKGDFADASDFVKARLDWDKNSIDTPLFAVHKRHKVATGAGTIEAKRFSRRTGDTYPGPVHVSVNNVIDYHVDTGSEIIVMPLDGLLNKNPGKLYGGSASDLMFSSDLALPKGARTFASVEDARKYLAEVTGYHGQFVGASQEGLPGVNFGRGWTNPDKQDNAMSMFGGLAGDTGVVDAFDAYLEKHVSKYLVSMGELGSFGSAPLQGRAMSIKGQLAEFAQNEANLRHTIKIKQAQLTELATTGGNPNTIERLQSSLITTKSELQDLLAMNQRWTSAMNTQGEVTQVMEGILGGGTEESAAFQSALGTTQVEAEKLASDPAFQKYLAGLHEGTAMQLTDALEMARTAASWDDIENAFSTLDQSTMAMFLRNYKLISYATANDLPDLLARSTAQQDKFTEVFRPLLTAAENAHQTGMLAMVADDATTTVGRALAEAMPPGFFTPKVEEMVEIAANAWQVQPEAMKQVFRDSVKLTHQLKNAPGPLGVLVENGIHEGHIFGFMLQEYSRDPATVLAQSPEMFFFFNSLARFTGDDVIKGNIPRVTTKLLDRADGIHMAQSAIHHLQTWIHPAGIEPLSNDGRYFMHLMGQHLTRMRLGETTRGPYSHLFAAYAGRTVKNKKQIKGLIGQMRGNAKRMANAIASGDKKLLRGLRDSGFITATMVDEIPKLTQADRIILGGRFMDLHQVTGSLAVGKWDNWVTGTTRSYLSGKAFENAVKTYLTMGASSQGFLGVRSSPKGHDIIDILDNIRTVPGYTIDDKTYEIAGKMRGHFKQMRDIEKSVGILQSNIAAYFPHILAEEAMDDRRWAAVVDTGAVGGQFSRRLFANKHRKLLDTIENLNANEMAETAHKMFVDDPALAYTLRGAAHARAVSYQEMVLKLSKDFGVKHKAGELLEEGKALLSIRGAGDFIMDEDIVNYVNGFKKLVTNQSELKEFGNGWNTMLSWYKGWTLGVFPAYHARNLVSNMSQNYMSGMPLQDMLHYHVMARRIQKYGPALTDEFVTFADGTRHSLAEIWEAGQRRAVSGSGMYMAETQDIAQKTMKYHEIMGRAPMDPNRGFGIFDKMAQGGARKELKATLGAIPTKKGLKGLAQWVPLAGRRDSKLLATGFLVGRGIENNGRWAQFLFSSMNGHSFDDSRLRVAKFLFDYDDISIGVASLKKLFPFITWSRKNIPLQISHLVMQPSKVARFAKAKDYIEDNVDSGDVDFPDLPQFIRENVPLSWRKLPDGTFQYFLMGNWLAMADLDRIFSPGENTMNLLFPGIRVPFELGANYSFFYKTQIDRGIPGDTKKFLGMNLSPKTAHVLRSIRVLNETNRLFGLGDAERESISQNLLRSALGLRLTPVDLEQEQLKRHRDYADKLGRKLADERYRKRQR